MLYVMTWSYIRTSETFLSVWCVCDVCVGEYGCVLVCVGEKSGIQ